LEGGGTRLKILEAMALGVPVVATSKGAEGLDATHGENILVADEPADFARCVVEVLRNPDLRARLSANARCLVTTQYDWQPIGRRFVALVEATVERQAAISSRYLT
jgi:glycosyltransferase involved in cell wall biosynthesis